MVSRAVDVPCEAVCGVGTGDCTRRVLDCRADARAELSRVFQSTVESNLRDTQQMASVEQGGQTATTTIRVGANPALVNNLNLIALDPADRIHLGNGQGRGRGGLLLDSRNNVEVLQIEGAAAGRWTLDVVASNVPQGPQDFALAAVLV